MTTVPAEVIGKWASYLEQELGLSFAGSRGDLLSSVVASADTEPATCLADRGTASHIYDALTNQESYFFREPSRLALIERHATPGWRDKEQVLRVWSAGCAAGEEAYTLAMLLNDSRLAHHYRIVGTDLSPVAVAGAERGVYGTWSLRGLDPSAVSRYFTSVPEGYRVHDEFRANVHFEQHNVLAPRPPAGGGPFDLILCRNVLIYFTPNAVRRAGEALAAALAPGGWLLLAVSDPLLDGVAALEAVPTRHGVSYRRRVQSLAPAPSVPPAEAVTTRRPASSLRSRTRARKPGREDGSEKELAGLVSGASQALELARPRSAAAMARRALTISSTSWAAHALLIQALAQDGRLEESVDAAAATVGVMPHHGEARQLLALMLLELGRAPEARVVAREAVYLSPELASAHLVLARAHALEGDETAARRARRNAHDLISRGRRR